ncbi:MFS transporter [Ideonella sp. A 288]|uniref:MFS transporter n=1 Tax=Ideonella sp. A 288 TaxID=1962181 RepID=UPI000B4B15B5|nr:MFS transporter [Ideonella sp. A 288]
MLSPLARALPAMTALQATVALGCFSLSVLAPQLGLSVAQLAGLNTVLFGVGTVGALMAGRWLRRWGAWPVAALCAGAVAAGTLCLLVGGPLAPWLAVLLFGLAFGPETPASAAVLTRITPPARRPWVFSVRQTGNQIGAMAGSVLLPALMVFHPRAPFVAIAAVATAMAAWCLLLSRDKALAAERSEAAVDTSPRGQGLRRVLSTRPLRALAFATLTYTAAQMCLNTFLMSLAVREWQLEVAHAGAWVATLQAAGLAGRLFWGRFAQRCRSAGRLLALIGLLIASAGIPLMVWPTAQQGLPMAVLVAVLGFTASGWNGVLVAEVSRIAGPAGAGALTGAVLVFGYAGLTLAPLAFAAASGVSSMALAFTGVFAAAGAAGAVLWHATRDSDSASGGREGAAQTPPG